VFAFGFKPLQKETANTSSLFQGIIVPQLLHCVLLFRSVEEQKEAKSIEIPVKTIALHFGHLTNKSANCLHLPTFPFSVYTSGG
jgi:hypothetical protein